MCVCRGVGALFPPWSSRLTISRSSSWNSSLQLLWSSRMHRKSMIPAVASAVLRLRRGTWQKWIHDLDTTLHTRRLWSTAQYDQLYVYWYERLFDHGLCPLISTFNVPRVPYPLCRRLAIAEAESAHSTRMKKDRKKGTPWTEEEHRQVRFSG